MWFTKTKGLSEEAMEVTASLKALKTLSCVNGRVSVQPSEVIDRPGYLSARSAAASLARPLIRQADSLLRELCDADLAALVSSQIIAARLAGMSIEDALKMLALQLGMQRK